MVQTNVHQRLRTKTRVVQARSTPSRFLACTALLTSVDEGQNILKKGCFSRLTRRAWCHKFPLLGVIASVDITNSQTAEISDDCADLESVFAAHSARVARTIALVTGDRGRAEELAVEVFLRWSQKPSGTSLIGE